MLIEQQIAERRERAASAVVKILERPADGPYGDYRVQSASQKTYRVAMRGPSLFENYCSCPDFAVNTLGTCKHIEGLLWRLRQRHGKALERKHYQRDRASISLQYGDTIEVRLRLPASPSAALRSMAADYFDATGLLRREHFRQFAGVLDAFRKADDHAVIYSDALEYIERENEIAEGLELEKTVAIPPLRLVRFRLELRQNHRFVLVCHIQDPIGARYRLAMRSLESKAVIGRVGSTRIVLTRNHRRRD